jgi:hypothetical protein
MPLQATSGAASYDAFGGGVPVVPNYIEDVFSTWLFSGNNSSQTIVNNIDLSTNGGLVWIKPRNITDTSNTLYDTARGVNKQFSSESDGAESTTDGTLTAFNTNGFSIGTSENASTNGSNNASWTFRKQPKFFDVVTWTGTGANRTIAHNLGSVPGCIMVKRRNLFSSWSVYHRSLANTKYLTLNTNDDVSTDTTTWNSTTATSTVFSLGTDTRVNASGGTYVAYIFAHDAGGFGLTGTDNVISCGSFNASGGVGSVNLGYEPQWLLFKQSNGFDDWLLFDNMRGMPTAETEAALLRPNSANAELAASGAYITPTATGFNFNYGGGGLFIYIAIRRGPMKVPTSGTSVFAPVTYTGNGTAGRSITAGFPVDLAIGLQRTPANGSDRFFVNRLVGATKGLVSWDKFAEATDANSLTGFDSMTSVTVGTDTTDRGFNGSGRSLSPYFLKRAPSFMDIVCYTGTGSTRNITHNLGVSPEMIIVKDRTTGNTPFNGNWYIYLSSLGTGYEIGFNSNGAASATTTTWGTGPTTTTFGIGTKQNVNYSNDNFVAFLFSTCAGVSKVGSYTGNGSSQTINCGFTGGARFVMIKATSTTGDWMVSDSARGIVSGNDPYLEFNNTNAEVTGEDWLDTDSTGFVVNEVSGSNANTNGVTYIFLAIA